MKWLNDYRMRLVVIGVMAAIMLSGHRRAKAEIIMSEPTNVGPVINDATGVQECDFSADGLELYFASGGIHVARRETIECEWIERGPVIMSGIDPAISPNGLELYSDIWGDWYLRVATRSSKDDVWGNRVKVGPPVGSYDAYTPDISADGLSLYFASYDRPGGYGSDDLWVATRATIEDEWSEPVNLGANVNSSGSDMCPSISSDGLTLVFNRTSPWSLWATTRKSVNDEWGPAVNLNINGPGYFYGPALSPDGSTIYFDASASWGGYGDDDLWQVTFTPIIDFNSDGIVDASDMCIMVDNWHTNNTLCDIAPLPLGDGFVDIKDLMVLAEHLFEEVDDPTLIAYWKMDETEGDIAYNNISENHGILSGNPVWQPDSGQVAGALQFDGVDDYISTDFVLNPADGQFSVFAWIKGGAPGQVILSQTGGANWLSTDPSEGKLMTELVPTTTRAPLPPLVSDIRITDGNWHHIGFVWTNARRELYVDGVLAAEDTQSNLASSNNGLYIGASKDLDAGTFFSGMIDDVRIYKQALTTEEIAILAQ